MGFTTEAFTLLGIGLGFIFLRTYARLTKTGMSGFKADDYLMLLAAVVYAAETTLAYTVGAYWQGLANNGMTDAERAALSPDSEEYRMRVNGSKTQVAGWSTYTLLLWLLKASMCTFYLRLTEGLEYQLRIYVGFGLIFTTWVAVLLSILLGCRPLSKNWQIYPDPGNFCQPAISRIDIFVTVVLNVLTDLYLLSIPLPMLWKANLRPAKKIGLMVLFSGGIFVTTAAILRCVLIVTNPVTGAEQAGSWACRETFVAVVTSNLPMIFPLMRRWGAPLFSSMRSGLSSRSKKTGGKASAGGNNTGGTGRSVNGMFILDDKNSRRGMGPRSVNPLTNITFSESEEHIYNEQLQQQQNDLEQQQQQQQQNERKQQRHSRTSKQSGHNMDIEQQALSSRPSFQAGASSSGTGSAAVATVVRSGITKQVVLQITEEERQRRRSTFGEERHGGGASDAESSNSSMDMLEAMIPGARQGNYFLTENNSSSIQQKQQRSSNTRSGDATCLSTSAASAASPLAAVSWDGRPEKDDGGDTSVDDGKRMTTSSRRR